MARLVHRPQFPTTSQSTETSLIPVLHSLVPPASLGGQDEIRDVGLSFAQQFDQRLEQMRALTAAAGAPLFKQLAADLNLQISKVSSSKELLWQYAQTFDYHKCLDYQTYEEMQAELNGIPFTNHSRRSIDSIRRIRLNWGPDFHTHIRKWPVPAGEQLLTKVLRVSRSTTLAEFTSRVHTIIASRVGTKHRRGVRHDNVLRASDMIKYCKTWLGKGEARRRKRCQKDLDDTAPGRVDLLTSSFTPLPNPDSDSSSHTYNTSLCNDDNTIPSPHLQLSTTDTIQECLSSMDGFDTDIIEMLGSLKLLTWTDICQKTKDGDTTNWPRLLKAEQCWKSGPPKINDLHRETVVKITDGSATAFRRGEADPNVDPLRALAQSFIDPEPLDPVFLTGLRLPSVSDDKFLVPEELSKYVESLQEENVQAHLCPKFTNVIAHTDIADGISVTLGKSVKTWLLFPPSDHNLKLMQSVEGHRQKLVRIGRSLEGGCIFQTTSATAIYIPAMWIHETFTTEGGFLVAKDFTTSSSALPMSRYLSLGLDQWLTADNQEMLFEWYSRCLEGSLFNHHAHEALDAWIQSRERIVKLVETPPKWTSSWLRKVKRIWISFLGSQHDHPEACPCGETLESFPQHFRAVHLSMFNITQKKGKKS